MAICLRPKRGWDTGEKHDSGKPKLKFTSHYIDYIIGDNGLPNHKYTEISCGKCINCRLKYSQGWALRCAIEAKQHKENYFITLTYNQENLPLNKHNEEYIATLKTKDITNFLKRLRIHYERKYKHTGIKYYLCGEYGDRTARPHYHMMGFNLPINDLKIINKNFQEDNLYESKEIEKIWGKGNVIIGQANYISANYIARYVLKQKNGKNSKMKWLEEGREPIFTRMSTRPAIGIDYLKKNWEEIYSKDGITIATDIAKAMTLKPPKYYDRWIEENEKMSLETIKKEREKQAKISYKETLKNKSMTTDEYIAEVERIKNKKSKRLIRPI